MKKQQTFILKMVSAAALLTFLFLFSSCALSFPPEWNEDYGMIRVILKVEPDDAQVMLNGKWIGDAYEFSTPKTAIRLNSRNTELVLKREGYIEEAVDLFDYRSDTITVRMSLRPDRDYRETTKPAPRVAPKTKLQAPEKTAPTPKTEPDVTPPTEPDEDNVAACPEVKTVELSLNVLPEESSIYLNGKFWGISPEGGKIENIGLKQGKYSIEVVKPGYKTYKKSWDFKEQKANLTILLEKE